MNFFLMASFDIAKLNKFIYLSLLTFINIYQILVFHKKLNICFSEKPIYMYCISFVEKY